MTDVPFDPVDGIMRVMEVAFDPVYGEAWNRRQIGDALTFRHNHFQLLDIHGSAPLRVEDTAGFILSRHVVDEEELLLIAVAPSARGRGVGSALLRQFISTAGSRGAERLFLEMRDGNPAAQLYMAHGFKPMARRINYYRTGTIGPLDAITYVRTGH